MGYTRSRAGRDGKPRYTAYYWDIRGRERSAGTFSSRKDADRAWQREEVKVAEGSAEHQAPEVDGSVSVSAATGARRLRTSPALSSKYR